MAEPSYLERSKASKRLVDLQARREARDKAKHDTISGMTIQQAKKIRELEEKIKDNFEESGYIIDKQGNIVTQTVPLMAGLDIAHFPKKGLEQSKDAVLIHNHPSHEFYTNGKDHYFKYGKKQLLGKGMAARIGISLSTEDIEKALKYDMKAVRAVTPTYEFSLSRGENGWGNVKPEEVNKLWKTEFNKVVKEYNNIDYQNDTEEQQLKKASRIQLLASHRATQVIAKKFGWTYTRVKRSERSKNDEQFGGKIKPYETPKREKSRVLKKEKF